MNVRVPLASLAVTAALAGATVLGVTAVQAEGSNAATLVEAIATRFNLNEDEVQAVFDEHHDTMQAEREAEFSERLQAKVDDGTITLEQKTAIETAWNTLHESREELRPEDFENLTEEERQSIHDQMEEARQTFEQTLEDNGIDKDDIMPMQGGHGFGHRFGRN